MNPNEKGVLKGIGQCAMPILLNGEGEGFF